MRRVVLILAAIAGVLSFSACGGSAPSPSLDGTVGYWQATGDTAVAAWANGRFLMQVEKRGDTYRLGIDGKPTRPAKLADGRIVLPWVGAGSRPAEFGRDGERAALFAWVSHGKNPEPGEPTGFFWAPFPVKRLTASTYERLAAAKADSTTYYDLLGLDLALREWTKQHDGRPPAEGDLTPDSEFGRWVDARTVWPTNPFTGSAMRAGAGPGEFSYTADGTSYTLMGHLYDGSTISPSEEPPPGLG